MILFSQLKAITGGSILSLNVDEPITTFLTDSRKFTKSPGVLFFAIEGKHHDGHQFIQSLYESGVRHFVVEKAPVDLKKFTEGNFLKVDSSLSAIQKIAGNRRNAFSIPVIGITGSNGKTIIKEWLFQLLSSEYKIVKNPGSYNSQLGVPLSVWQMENYHQLAVFEAGISKPGEMKNLRGIIQPTIGLFTNIGPAHDEGFKNIDEKIDEKLELFTNCEILIYCADHKTLQQKIQTTRLNTLTWGYTADATIQIKKHGEQIEVRYKNDSMVTRLPFSDPASVENCLHCVAVMIYLGYSLADIREKLKILRSIPMRLELKEGINQCQIIDDTYNNDLSGLQISLEFLSNQQQKKKKRLILSDIEQSGLQEEVLTAKIAALVSSAKVDFFVGIGPVLKSHAKFFPATSKFFETTEDFLKAFPVNELSGELILVKGARSFQFERIIKNLQKKVHGTIMEIDLGAVVNNLNYFKSLVRPSTKMMVMVKAFAYGSGSIEIANLLQYHKVDYLGVAYADEGIELRKNNITLPLMVMNPSEDSFDQLLEFDLEPELYSFGILRSFLRHRNTKPVSIHIKLDTGMHRLGFTEEDIDELIEEISKYKHVKVASIFSHLAGADEADHDAFSRKQGALFKSMADKISQSIGYKPLYHILNSPGTLRLPDLQFDMVRLGIGLYGVNPTHENVPALKPVATLKTFISQVKHIHRDETVGYGRRGKADKDLDIATIAIGYADGFNRAFSRGVGSVLIKGKLAPVIGNVCMDMTMIDVTDIGAIEGDEVIIFGKELPINDVASKINTIPYEILTNTSERVKRVFVAESI